QVDVELGPGSDLVQPFADGEVQALHTFVPNLPSGLQQRLQREQHLPPCFRAELLVMLVDQEQAEQAPRDLDVADVPDPADPDRALPGPRARGIEVEPDRVGHPMHLPVHACTRPPSHTCADPGLTERPFKVQDAPRVTMSTTERGGVTMTTATHTGSSTLYFGPWYRKSPFFERTLAAGCQAYDIYNHMYLPGYYGDPVEEYWHLLNHVTIWDVAVERIVQIEGPDALALTNMLTCRDLTRC